MMSQVVESPIGREEFWWGQIHGYRYPTIHPAYALLIAHGTGGHGGTYDVFAQPIAALGADVYSIDLPGHGKARNESGNWRFVEWLDEVGAAAKEIKSRTGLPVFVLGSSKGAAVAFHALAHSSAVDGAITMGLFLTEVPPPVSLGMGRRYREYRSPEGMEIAHTEGDRRRIDLERQFDWNKSYAQNDPDVLEKKKIDPLRTWSWGYASEHSYMTYEPPQPASANTKPVLVTVGGNDPLHPPEYVKQCFDVIGGPKEFQVVAGAGHQLMTYHTQAYVPLVHEWCIRQAQAIAAAKTH